MEEAPTYIRRSEMEKSIEVECELGDIDFIVVGNAIAAHLSHEFKQLFNTGIEPVGVELVWKRLPGEEKGGYAVRIYGEKP